MVDVLTSLSCMEAVVNYGCLPNFLDSPRFPVNAQIPVKYLVFIRSETIRPRHRSGVEFLFDINPSEPSSLNEGLESKRL